MSIANIVFGNTLAFYILLSVLQCTAYAASIIGQYQFQDSEWPCSIVYDEYRVIVGLDDSYCSIKCYNAMTDNILWEATPFMLENDSPMPPTSLVKTSTGNIIFVSHIHNAIAVIDVISGISTNTYVSDEQIVHVLVVEYCSSEYVALICESELILLSSDLYTEFEYPITDGKPVIPYYDCSTSTIFVPLIDNDSVMSATLSGVNPISLTASVVPVSGQPYQAIDIDSATQFALIGEGYVKTYEKSTLTEITSMLSVESVIDSYYYNGKVFVVSFHDPSYVSQYRSGYAVCDLGLSTSKIEWIDNTYATKICRVPNQYNWYLINRGIYVDNGTVGSGCLWTIDSFNGTITDTLQLGGYNSCCTWSDELSVLYISDPNINRVLKVQL